jgi:DNA processing protein
MSDIKCDSQLELTLLALVMSRLPGFDAQAFQSLLSLAKPSQILAGEVSDSLPSRVKMHLLRREVLSEALSEMKRAEELEIEIVAFSSPLYPQLLSKIYAAPLIFYLKRDKNSIRQFNQTIAIVGARNSQNSSEEIVKEISGELASQGVTVVSGLAVGVDATAHRAALRAKSHSTIPTVAVLAHGLDTLYPRCNIKLSQDILAQGGWLLSTFQISTPALPANFLMRNRIIAGLSSAVVVVQASLRSGSLVTAKQALEEGREVLVVPGQAIGDSFSGSHKLLKEGAQLVTSAQDIFELLPEVLSCHSLKEENCAQEPLSFNTNDMFSQLRKISKNGEPVALNQLLTLAPHQIEVEKELLELELIGKIIRLPGEMIRVLKS